MLDNVDFCIFEVNVFLGSAIKRDMDAHHEM